MTKEKDKAKTQSGTPAGTGTGTGGGIDLEKLMQAAAGMGGTVSEGPTRQDAVGSVQSIYQQILGRSSAGAEFNKAINLFMSQPAGTDMTGRQQAVVDFIQATPEFRKRQENRYLDAIYNAVAEDVRKARV